MYFDSLQVPSEDESPTYILSIMMNDRAVENEVFIVT
jgi:hypothetical protein